MRLLRIQIDDSQLQKLGLTKYSRNIKTTLISMATLAANSFKSKVPIETGQLRDNIVVNVSSSRIADINLNEFTHSSPRGTTIGSSNLAKILQDNQGLKRRMDSQAEAPFTAIARGAPTAGWITSGRNAFYASYKKYLKIAR